MIGAPDGGALMCNVTCRATSSSCSGVGSTRLSRWPRMATPTVQCMMGMGPARGRLAGCGVLHGARASVLDSRDSHRYGRGR